MDNHEHDLIQHICVESRDLNTKESCGVCKIAHEALTKLMTYDDNIAEVWVP